MTKGRLAFSLLAMTIGLSVLAQNALATDGVIEINQAKVMAAGGFPFVISNPGSYRLTSNLVNNSASDVIQVKTDLVSIDLNGFYIVGPSTGSGVGINASGSQLVAVTNGRVFGMGGLGILLGDS